MRPLSLRASDCHSAADSENWRRVPSPSLTRRLPGNCPSGRQSNTFVVSHHEKREKKT